MNAKVKRYNTSKNTYQLFDTIYQLANPYLIEKKCCARKKIIIKTKAKCLSMAKVGGPYNQNKSKRSFDGKVQRPIKTSKQHQKV